MKLLKSDNYDLLQQVKWPFVCLDNKDVDSGAMNRITAGTSIKTSVICFLPSEFTEYQFLGVKSAYETDCCRIYRRGSTPSKRSSDVREI